MNPIQHKKIKVRLFVSDSLIANGIIALNANQSHYLRNVMRLKISDYIAVFNGYDGEYSGVIIEDKGKGLIIKIEKNLRPQMFCKSLVLCIALAKNHCLYNVIRQATEMGVTTIQLVDTEFSVNKHVNVNKLQLIAIEAAEQSNRLDVPEVKAAVKFHDLPHLYSQSTCILCDETGRGKMPHEVLKDKKNMCIIVGPEGGFSTQELNKADNFCIKLSLGYNILKVDTAVVCALAYAMEYYKN